MQRTATSRALRTATAAAAAVCCLSAVRLTDDTDGHIVGGSTQQLHGLLVRNLLRHDWRWWIARDKGTGEWRKRKEKREKREIEAKKKRGQRINASCD